MLITCWIVEIDTCSEVQSLDELNYGYIPLKKNNVDD